MCIVLEQAKGEGSCEGGGGRGRKGSRQAHRRRATEEQNIGKGKTRFEGEGGWMRIKEHAKSASKQGVGRPGAAAPKGGEKREVEIAKFKA
jgi:hypothetical protein